MPFLALCRSGSRRNYFDLIGIKRGGENPRNELAGELG